MQVYPAIDLIDGGCVRLEKGQFDAVTKYSGDPVEMAQKYKSEGANWAHVVDLDGARDSAKKQSDLIEKICKDSGLKIQSGGGVRSYHDVKRMLNCGVDRVVIGSLAVKDPDSVRRCFEDFGAEKICLAVDVKPNGSEFEVVISGWQEDSGFYLSAVLDMYLDVGLTHILCTDVSRDGMMGGCNLNLYRDLKTKYPDLSVQASGGVSSTSDVDVLRAMGIGGVVIGKALYEGKVSLPELLKGQ
ncbi:MAG TPA: 1-(5-phosphoribosyl)-5-[(5-phosphoribosylamino)methylideneamino]imidazole-4-carboxamide isomerase [Alphaproteobacteria bacterium]|nr:1-(5-phosphoribosyl)-5-[(5-phosphoribosylamino)methylideneamino]imidazole-4-carboxamide isomerase [Alphaproteobacteria bacterium]HOO51598.1 1-(5-phosphoribosyl)-5-[(5-phosphoribosylamino)methylideneamino]imidazole-4-carboxamide isomerase [Alphaproteobacteria bacterium]